MSIRKPKIAIIHQGVGIVPGGSENFVTNLSLQLSQYCDVTLFCGKPVNVYCQPIHFLYNRHQLKQSCNPLIKWIERFLSHHSDNPHLVFEYLSMMPDVFYQLLTKDFDVIYPANNWGGLAICSLVRAIKGTPILYKEMDAQNPKNHIRNIKFKPNLYISETTAYKQHVEKTYPFIKVYQIPNGIDVKRFDVPKNTKRPSRFSGPIVFSAGEYIPRKRLELIIQAVAKLDNVNLMIACFGENIQELRHLGIELLGPNRFELLANVPYDEMPYYYASADLFTLPSLNESFGNVYIEALASGLPIVAPDDMVRREVVGNAGLFCDVEDIDAYAETLDRALKMDWRSLPNQQANNFSWERTTQGYYDAILSLLNGE